MRTGLQDFWRRFKRNRTGVLGLWILLFFTAIAIAAPIIYPANPLALGEHALASPSVLYPFGTDDLGRNVFGDVIWGARVSIFVGLLASIISTTIGIVVGGASGYIGAKTDVFLMRLTESFMVIPAFVLAVVVVALFGANIWFVIGIIGALSWPTAARLVRAEFVSIRELEYVEAAKAVGSSSLHIVFREILPNSMAPIIVNATLQVGQAIMLEAGLAFLGLNDFRFMSWGYMLGNATLFMSKAWWMAVFPGIALCLTIISSNLLGDGLNDALNPRLKEG